MANYKGDLNVDIGAKLNKVERALDKLKSDFNRSSQQISATGKKTSSNLENSLGGSFKRLGAMAVAAFGTQQLLQFGSEAVQLAGKLEGVERAFLRLNKPTLLSELREATRGTITDLELMQKAVRADNFKIPLTQLATYFKFATDRAAQTGESVEYLVNSIVDGIGRKSTLVLDNLGISASELQQEVKKVGDFGLAVGNIIERQMAKGGDSMITTAQKTQALQAQFQNLKTEIGTQLTPAFSKLLTVANSFLSIFSKNEQSVKQFNVGWDLLNNGLEKTKETTELLERALGRQLTMSEKATILWSGFTDEQIKAADSIKQLDKTINKDAGSNRYAAYINSGEEFTEQQKELGETVELTTEELNKQILALQTLRLEQEALTFEKGVGGGVPFMSGEQRQEVFNEMTSMDKGDDELDNAIASASRFLETNKEIGQQLSQNSAMSSNFFNLLVTGFNTVSGSANDFQNKMVSVIENLLVEVTRFIVRLIVVNTLLKALGIPVGVSGSMLGGLGGLGSGVPRFAQGGMTTGPTLAMIGDNPSGKEAVIPFEKMGAFLNQYGGGGNVNVTGHLIGRGEDLLVTLDKTQARRQNFYKG